MLEKYAKKGSLTAVRLIWAVNYYFKSLEYLQKLNEDIKNVELFFENLAKAFSLEEYVCQF